MPVAAVLAGMAFGPLERTCAVRRGGSCSGWRARLQVSATVLAVPSGWKLPGLGVPFVLESPPSTANWRQREILALISKDSRGEPVTVSVVPNDNFFLRE